MTNDQSNLVNDLLSAINSATVYWSHLPQKTEIERCEGLAFSILNIIDGTSGSFDGCFRMIVESDEYPKGTEIPNVMLHEMWGNYKRKRDDN